jgi:hypothetical protein
VSGGDKASPSMLVDATEAWPHGRRAQARGAGVQRGGPRSNGLAPRCPMLRMSNPQHYRYNIHAYIDICIYLLLQTTLTIREQTFGSGL